MAGRFKIPSHMEIHTFGPAEACIYCSATGVPLSTEHIVPEGIGGMYKLPSASCTQCAARTSALEGRVISRIYGDARAHLGTRRKRNKKFSDNFSVRREVDGRRETVVVSLSDHPGAITTIDLKNRPAILCHQAPSDADDWGHADVAVWFAPSAAANIAKIGGRVTVTNDLPLSDFAKFLARIAHSYASATLGPGAFRAFLAEAIISENPKHLPHFIGGSSYGMPPCPQPDLHGLLLSRVPHDTMPHLWQVSIQLFAPLGFPVYDVIVGEVTHDPFE
jgi:hypothetical protein